MVIYCDCLNAHVCVKLIQLYWRGLFLQRTIIKVQVLDPLSGKWRSLFLKYIMQRLGFRIEEARFFAGHLRKPDGEVIYSAAANVSKELAFKVSESILLRSKCLEQLNRKWGRNTILKHIASSLQMPVMKIAMQFMAADTLSKKETDNTAFLIVKRYAAFDSDLLRVHAPNLQVLFYRTLFNASLKRNRLSVLILLFYRKLREMKWLFESFIRRESNIRSHLKTSEPSLLVLQEDDLSLDRSYRTQPHWLFAEDGKPPFQTIVLKTGSVARLSVDAEVLKSLGISPISEKDLYLLSRQFRHSNPVHHLILKDIWKCVITSFWGSSVEIETLFEITMLLYNANLLATFCERYNVKAFMTCENYMEHADAMILIASSLNIFTLSYQYSNMSKAGPIMMTTADLMLTFSPLYHHRWTYNGIGPGKFADIGYLYDTSFKYVRSRAYERKRALEKAGAQFVICYFDENVQTDKYGLVSEDDHYSEILMLMKLVLDDPSVGLIIKTQFQWNSPTKYTGLTSTRAAVNATGRYVELSYGIHRNIVFPAEAALSADISIGHSIGATAPLEAALSGARCILLNPYGIKNDNDILYAKSNIVYPSITSALSAINSFRSGNRDCANLGGWSPIIDQFDSFRDERASYRLRNFLEEAVLGSLKNK